MHWFDEIVTKTELIVLWIHPNRIQKVREFLVLFGESGDQSVGLWEVVEILEVKFEKMYFFLNFIKDDFVVRVALSLAEDGSKEKLIQSAYFFDI